MPVRDPEHPLSQRESRRAVAEGGDHSGELVANDRLGSIVTGAIDPRRGPLPLCRDEARRMDLNDDVVDRRRRLRPLRECDPGCLRALVRRDDCLHCYLRICLILTGSVRRSATVCGPRRAPVDSTPFTAPGHDGRDPNRWHSSQERIVSVSVDFRGTQSCT